MVIYYYNLHSFSHEFNTTTKIHYTIKCKYGTNKKITINNTKHIIYNHYILANNSKLQHPSMWKDFQFMPIKPEEDIN